jgi:hypothetical protein
MNKITTYPQKGFASDMVAARNSLAQARDSEDALEALDLATHAVRLALYWGGKEDMMPGARRDAYNIAEAAMVEVRNAILPNITADWKDD